MGDQSAPPTADGTLNEEVDKIIIATYTCTAAIILSATFFIHVTRFRLWHSNWILEKIPKVVDHPVTSLIGICAASFSVVPYRNDLYWIWLTVLLIAYDNVLTVSSAGSTIGTSDLLREYITLFNGVYLGIFINKNNDGQEYHVPLLILWLFMLSKFTARLVCHKLVKRAYGLNNSKLIADYMKIEHELTKSNEVIDPTNMKGYKYLVMGEGKINAKITGSKYTPEIKLPAGVVTVEKVWSCNERLLDPAFNEDNRLRDVCLSFAFFKLLKRRFYGYPAAEAQQEKTRRLVFDGLLSRDNDSVYRVIAMEIGFIRDLLYTRYPVIFAFGFPVFQVILLTGMLGVSMWISVMAFNRREDPQNSYLRRHHHNIDYTITNALLIVIMSMEAFETLTYVFSDWTKVLVICRHVRRQKWHHNHFYYKVLALHCKLKFDIFLNNTIGQYSLLENYNKSYPGWLNVNCFPYSVTSFPSYSSWWLNLNCFPYSSWWWSPLKVAPKGMKKDKPVILSPDVKGAILDSLRLMSGYPTNGVASLKRNGVYDDLAWTCGLETEFHTLIVWHLATGLCGIRPVQERGKEKLIEPHHLVASRLSNYCAYLMVFLPDMLPESIFSMKLFFRMILSETREFFNGAHNSEDRYNLMMTQAGGHGNRVIDMGARLGRYLMEIPDDTSRWKIMADFWSDFLIFLTPSGKEREHLRKLESGGEFITHLWALLYHAGMVDHTTTASSGFYP